MVGEAGDGREALALVATTDPDVVVMDLAMPVLDGLAATAPLVASGARQVLVLTLSEEDANVLAAMRAGASGYLVKGVAADQVVSAVTRSRPGMPCSGRAWPPGCWASGPTNRGGPRPALSAREHEVLRAGQG